MMEPTSQTTETIVATLPEALHERTRMLKGKSLPSSFDFVLYWMRTAARVDENPALEVAIETANNLDLPVFVYHALSERYRYASDRHHTFILQGARDVQASIARRNVAYAFHLERPGQRGPHLKTLSRRAALVITEDMPVEPLRGWTNSLCCAVETPILAVDTACVAPMQFDGLVRPWSGRIVALENGSVKEEKAGTERFVAVPEMKAVCRHLAGDLEIHPQTEVMPLRRNGDQWHLSSAEADELGVFDVAIVSVPAAQTAELISAAPRLAERAIAAEMRECWAAMIAIGPSLGLSFDGAFVHKSPLSWIARNNSKPGRSSEPETWVLHASPDWSGAHIEKSPAEIEGILIDEFWKATGQPSAPLEYRRAHRWRYASPTEPLAETCLFDPDLQVGACGDWCGGPRVEGAFLSGTAMAGRVLGLLEKARPSQTAGSQQIEMF